MKFNLFTMVYGDYHLKLFFDACFRSMNWPKNQVAIAGCDWHVFTKKEHFADIEREFEGKPYRLVLIDMGPGVYITGVGTVDIKKCDNGVIMLHGLRTHVRYCLENDSRMLFAPPDTIFGDGTVANLLKAGEQPGAAVMVAHPRVLPSFVEEIKYLAATEGACSNAKLVSLFNKHAHASWTKSEQGYANNASFESGVLWREVSKNLVQVQHRLPTAYLVHFTLDDWNYWWGASSFGDYDHRWPGENFIRQERERFVGSSDACFIVEVTDHDKNVSKDTPPEIVGRIPVDGYFNIRHHNSINRQFLTYFRGE